jgi:hypothetical protein
MMPVISRAGCGTITAALNSLSPAGRICVTCKARARRTECARCGRIAAPAARRPCVVRIAADNGLW